MDKRYRRNRDSKLLFDMRTIVDTSNRFRCRRQTTTTERLGLMPLVRASMFQLLYSILMPRFRA
ncbi:MAG TPA: hypothetical protein VKA97_05650, partial [Pyrinomonadaceae bacterium]|nr:hypothetical protein [Pyrinomonadaceae bacterium]